MISLLNTVEESIKAFIVDMTTTLGFFGVLGIVVGIELLFVLFYAIKSAFSYEARLKRSLDKVIAWLFKYRTITEANIKRFNAFIKTGPKRFVYYWQQFILYRDGGPTEYMSEENLIKKPLKTSSWANNVKNLTIVTAVWSVISCVLGLAMQASSSTLTIPSVAFALLFPVAVLLLGTIALLAIRGRRATNLDEIYHLYNLFARFIENACVDLTPYIDFNLLFTAKEIEKGNSNLREYYEQRTRKAKEEFDTAKENDIKFVEYNFKDVGVDGSLLLDRAMKESEKYINKKTKTLSQIAQVETQKETRKRNYENVQIDLQRKIQASKENVKKLIEQQAATTSRIEVQLLKQQQDKEISKQTELQNDYDHEERIYIETRDSLDAEIQRLNAILEESLEEATTGMSNEYQSFFEKVMKNAYAFADKKVAQEKRELATEKEKCEDELIAVQTQIKHLLDENNILNVRLGEFDPRYKQKLKTKDGKFQNGVFVHKDGAFRDEKGLYHDVDGKVYTSLGKLVSIDENDEERNEREKEEMINNQVELFGTFVADNNPLLENAEQVSGDKTSQTKKEPKEVEKIEEPKQEPKSEEIKEVIEESATPQEVDQAEEKVNNGEAIIEEFDPNELLGVEIPDEEAQKNGSDDILNSLDDEIEESKQESEIEEGKEETKETEMPNEDDQNVSTEDTGDKVNFFDILNSIKNDSDEKPNKVETIQPAEETEQKEEAAPAKRRGRPKKEERKEEEAAPAKKRGRPKKEEKIEEPAKRRGRPRKTETTEAVTTSKKPTTKKANKTTAKKPTAKPTTKKATAKPTPKKTTAKKSTKKAEPKSQRRKSIIKNKPEAINTSEKRRGRPRKESLAITASEISSLARINQLIHEEEAKLNNMKTIINSQLDEAINKVTLSQIESERREILDQVEALQTQAISAQQEGKVEEFSLINKKVEELITRLAELNTK